MNFFDRQQVFFVNSSRQNKGILFMLVGLFLWFGCSKGDGGGSDETDAGPDVSPIADTGIDAEADTAADGGQADIGGLDAGGGDISGDTADPVQIEAYFNSQFNTSFQNIYWGEFHSHTNYSLDAHQKCNGSLNPDKALEYARNPNGVNFDFVALCDHSEMSYKDELPDGNRSVWKNVQQINKAYNNENSANGKVFIVFQAWEYTNTYGGKPLLGSFSGYGHKNVVFKNLEGVPDKRYGAFSVPDETDFEKANTAVNLWNALVSYRPASVGAEGTAITIIHTPAHKGTEEGSSTQYNLKDHQTDWEVIDSDFVHNVEIYSKWGNSEGPVPDAANCAEEDPPYDEETSATEESKSVRTVLYNYWVTQGKKAYILSFLGGTDNHKGMPGNEEMDQCGFHYTGARTGIIAASLTRDNLWTSLWNRKTLAAIGQKIPLLFALETNDSHYFMGSHSPAFSETIRLRAIAESPVKELHLIVDGCKVATISGNAMDITLSLQTGQRHFLYVRAKLENGRQAWSSPVYLGPSVD